MSINFIVSQIAVPLMDKIQKKLPILNNATKEYNKNFVGGNGATISIIIPDYGVVGTGPALTAGMLNYTAASVSLTLVQNNVAIPLTQLQDSLYISDKQEQIASQYSARLATAIQQAAAKSVTMASDAISVLSAGTFAELGNVIGSIKSARCDSEIAVVLSSELFTQVQNSGLQFFNPATQISDLFKGTQVYTYRGANVHETQDIASLSTGTWEPASSATVKTTVSADGATSITITDSTATSAFSIAEGQAFKVAGVKAVTRYGEPLSVDYAFVAQSSAVGAAGEITVTVKPIYFTGPLKNVSTSAIASGAVVTKIHDKDSTYIRGIAFAKNALAYGAARLNPISTTSVEFEDVDGGLSIMATEGQDVYNGLSYIRWDTLTGTKLMRSNFARTIDVKV